MKKIQQFTVVCLTFFLFSGVSISLVYLVSPILSFSCSPGTFPLRDAGILVYTLLYMILMWKDIYFRKYHHYLKLTYRLILRNLIISTLLSSAVFGPLLSFILLITPQTGIDSGDIWFIQRCILLVALQFLLFHVVQTWWIRHLHRIGFLKKNFLLFGSIDEGFRNITFFRELFGTEDFRGSIRREGSEWIYVSTTGDDECTNRMADFTPILYRQHIGKVIISLEASMAEGDVKDILAFCNDNSIGYCIIPNTSKLPYPKTWQPHTFTPGIEQYRTSRESLTLLSIKRLLDILVSFTGLVFFLPVWLFIGWLIRRQDGGPAIYASTRIGMHGKPIRFYKYRTMVANADSMKKNLMPLNDRKDGPLFKIHNDPRVTKIGKFLRRTSLDEIPQFFNVLKGDMSLIGPRPHLPEEVAQYGDRDHLRLDCIPGICCLPQVYGRDSLSFHEWVEYDLRYRNNWSLRMDLQIILKTVMVVTAPYFKSGKRNTHVYEERQGKMLSRD